MSQYPTVSRVFFAVMIGVLMLPSTVRADETRFTIGPGTMTFAQIAHRLSSRGRTVQCVSSLKDCGAFVYLKDRTWAQMRELLGAGLDIEIEPDTDKDPSNLDRSAKSAPELRWILRRDPAALSRERRYLGRYVDCLIAMMQSRAHEKLNTFSLNQNADFVASRQRFDDMNRENMAILFNKDRTPEDVKRRDRLMEGMVKLTAAEPSNWALAYLLSSELNAWEVRNAVAAGNSMKTLPSEQFPHAVKVGMYVQGRHIQPEGAWRDIVRRTQLPGDFTIWGGLHYDPVNLILTLSSSISADGSVDRLRERLDAATYYTPKAIYEPSGREDILWSGLGKDANEWLEVQRRETRSFLSSEEAHRPFALKTLRPVSSVSQIVELWSGASNAEVVMELLPTREPLLQIGSDLGQKNGVDKPVPGGKCQLSGLFSDADAWAFAKQDGVLLVKDEFAFVDRMYHFPIGAFIALERSLDHDNQLQLKDLFAYANSVQPGQSAQWDWVGTYRGIPNSTLTRFPPLMHLLSRMPGKHVDKDLATLLRTAQHPMGEDPVQITPRNAARIRLHSLPVSAWENLVSEYRALPRANPNWAWSPNAISMLSLCDVGCELAQGEDADATGEHVYLHLFYPDAASEWALNLKGFTRAALGQTIDKPEASSKPPAPSLSPK